MDEIEVKILETGHKDLEPNLISLGAEKIFDGELHAMFFDREDSEITNKGNTFRLRKEGDRSFLTYKEKKKSEHVKIRDETEIEVMNFEEMKKLINLLGFSEIKSNKKRRVSYKLDNVKFEFDTYLGEWDFIPEFMEIEAQNVDEIYKYVDLLGFSREDCKSWTGKDLVNYYKKD